MPHCNFFFSVVINIMPHNATYIGPKIFLYRPKRAMWLYVNIFCMGSWGCVLKSVVSRKLNDLYDIIGNAQLHQLSKSFCIFPHPCHFLHRMDQRREVQAESWAVAMRALWLQRGVSMEPDSEPTFRAYLLCGNKQTHSGGLCVAKLC